MKFAAAILSVLLPATSLAQTRTLPIGKDPWADTIKPSIVQGRVIYDKWRRSDGKPAVVPAPSRQDLQRLPKYKPRPPRVIDGPRQAPTAGTYKWTQLPHAGCPT